MQGEIKYQFRKMRRDKELVLQCFDFLFTKSWLDICPLKDIPIAKDDEDDVYSSVSFKIEIEYGKESKK